MGSCILQITGRSYVEGGMVQGTEGAYGEWLCADVVCHEVAHQWFGNLVTCANWAEITGRVPPRPPCPSM
jgi:hypothetical protein